MNTEPFVEAARELRGRFFSLIDSLSTLRGLTAIEIQHRPEEDLLRGALEVLLRHQDLERCSIFLVEHQRLECRAGKDWDDLFDITSGARTERHCQTFELGEGVMGEAARTGELVHCPDCRTDMRFVARPSGSTPIGALISSPIIARGDVLGVVNVYHPTPAHFESWHEHTLTLFCQVLGHMLENNRLLRRMEHAVEDRTRQLEAALREAEQLKRRYEQLSNVDELTSLHNRRFFFPETEAVVARSTRYGHPFSLMLLDVDRFKLVNDRFGHSTGDEVLRDISATIKAATREVDIIARFGGEEFVVALPSTDLGGARELAERVRVRVAALEWSSDETVLSTSVSVGVASLENRRGSGSELLQALLREADRAMYQAKANGRDVVCVYADLPAELAGEVNAGESTRTQ